MNRIKYKIWLPVYLLTFIFYILLIPDRAMATQGHIAPEGIYAHQLAHLFFILAMGFFIHWLREIKLVEEKGWRFIQYSALFLILWNVDALLAHLLDEQLGLIHVKRIDAWHIQITAVNNYKWLEVLYYITKLDHLLCVPALIFLYLGLKWLVKENRSEMVKPDIQGDDLL